MSFHEASEVFLASLAPLNASRRVQYVSERTLFDLACYLRTLGKFFGQLRLNAIHAGHIKTYQAARANADPLFTYKLGREMTSACVGAAKINDETKVLKRILQAAGAWTPLLAAQYRALDEPDTDIPRALSPEQQELWLATAESVPEWHLMWWYSLLALHTTFSSDELRTIRHRDIDLANGILAVNCNFGKNKYRRREIPLTDPDCLFALERLLERSWNLVGGGRDMHLFPVRERRGVYDGTQPVSESGFRKPFELVRDATGFHFFKLNGFRHTAITRMAEAGVAISVIQRRAGHISPKMTAHYTHISEAVERRAMKGVPVRKPVGSVRPPRLMLAPPPLQTVRPQTLIGGMQSWTGYRAFA